MRCMAQGFTLVEMIMTVVVVAILLTVAVPSFTSLIAIQKMRTAASSLQSSLSRARSEALKRNADVTIAPAQAGQWNSGWTISAASTNLAVTGAVAAVTITGPNSIVFRGSGRPSQSSGNAVFRLSSTQTSGIRCVSVGLTGIPNVASSGC